MSLSLCFFANRHELDSEACLHIAVARYCENNKSECNERIQPHDKPDGLSKWILSEPCERPPCYCAANGYSQANEWNAARDDIAAAVAFDTFNITALQKILVFNIIPWIC